MALLSLISWAVKPLWVGGAAVAVAALMHLVLPVLQPGKPRLVAATPAVFFFLLAPFAFDAHSELLSRASTAAVLTWLATFKLLCYVMGRGPLTDPSLSMGQFTALLLWPILHNEGPPENGATRVARLKVAGGSEGLKAAALERAAWRAPENLVIALVGAVTLVMPWVPLFLKTYSAAFGVCAYCGLWANAVAALVMYLNGLEVAPSWDRPWLQNCLSDFWSRRWNLPAAYTLRTLVFEPIMEGRAVKGEAGTTFAMAGAGSRPAQGVPHSSGTGVPAPQRTTSTTGAAVPRSDSEEIRDLGRPGRTSRRTTEEDETTTDSVQEDPYLNGEDEAQARTVRKMSLAVAAAVEEALAGPEPATPTQPVPTRTTPRPPSSSGAAAEGKLGAQHPRAGVAAEPAGEIQAVEEGGKSEDRAAPTDRKSSGHAPLVLRRRTTQTVYAPSRTSTVVSRRSTADSMVWEQELAAQKAVSAAPMPPVVWDTAENAEVVADEMGAAVDIQESKEGGLEAAIETAALADGVVEEVEEEEEAGGGDHQKDESWAAEVMVKDLKDVISSRLAQAQHQLQENRAREAGGEALQGDHQQGMRKRSHVTGSPTHEVIREEEDEGLGKMADQAPGKPQGGGRKVHASRRLLATAATFAVSGIMHEILLLICTGWHAYWPHAGRMTAYFMLQVPLSVAEHQLSRALKKSQVQVPDAIAIPVTSLTLQIPGLCLFWSPIFNAATTAMKQQ